MNSYRSTPAFARQSLPLTDLQRDAPRLLFALADAWPYVHIHCTIKSRRKSILALMQKHGDFADLPHVKKSLDARERAIDALKEVVGCFDAALAEGLLEALRDTEDERLKDLVERRLMYAFAAAVGDAS